MVLPCHEPGCTLASCTACDGIDTCNYCGLPYCSNHRSGHRCLGAGSDVPNCPWCDGKQLLGHDHACEICCEDVCQFCGTCYWYPASDNRTEECPFRVISAQRQLDGAERESAKLSLSLKTSGKRQAGAHARAYGSHHQQQMAGQMNPASPALRTSMAMSPSHEPAGAAAPDEY